MDLWVVEGEDAQGQKLWTGHEGDCVGPSVGWQVGPAVENIGYGNYIKAGRGLGIHDEDITLGQYERPVGRLGAGDEGGFDIEIEGKGFWQDAKAERELEAGGKGKGVRTELILGFGDEEELNARYDGQDGLGAGDEVLDLGKRPEGELETGDEVSVDEALRQQDASVSQVNAGVQEMDLESICSQSSTRYHREGIKQQSGENQIFCWGLSGEEQGKVTGDESFPQESSGTCVYQLRQHTQEEFEAWLQAEHAKLSRILRQRRKLTANELKLRQRELEELRSHVGLGQSFLQGLLTSQGGAGVDDPCLEELRYRWVLHKSKLQDAGDLRHHLGDKDGNALQKEPFRKVKVPAVAGLLGRVQCVTGFIHRSVIGLLALKKKQKLLDLLDHGGTTDVSTRWNSSYDMVDCFLEQQSAVTAALLCPELLQATQESLGDALFVRHINEAIHQDLKKVVSLEQEELRKYECAEQEKVPQGPPPAERTCALADLFGNIFGDVRKAPEKSPIDEAEDE
ncbi:uncharacterized protein LOC133128846 [Conger conger]|uniref:uncharacterized protein LOC133128846 n=1 Tax=Conger conger TaxID=82655 RepID=UPI002A59B958|nr:uncharacterized protein LOC133128846 [Conger conger]